MQVANAAYGVPNQSGSAAAASQLAGQLGAPSQQAALAAQGLATQQPTAAQAGVVHVPYPPGAAAAAAANAVQQFQMNGQPTTLAL
jgi:hypothetical protein